MLRLQHYWNAALYSSMMVNGGSVIYYRSCELYSSHLAVKSWHVCNGSIDLYGAINSLPVAQEGAHVNVSICAQHDACVNWYAADANRTNA